MKTKPAQIAKKTEIGFQYKRRLKSQKKLIAALKLVCKILFFLFSSSTDDVYDRISIAN